MNKKIGKTTVTGEFAENLKGFEDVFEDYVKSEEYKEIERKERENTRVGEQYELQYFLEQENNRLSGLESFLSKKISLKVNFSQTEKLIQVQMKRKSEVTEKLTDSMKKMDSQLQKNLAQLLNSHFS
jgi:hypothetical protein